VLCCIVWFFISWLSFGSGDLLPGYSIPGQTRPLGTLVEARTREICFDNVDCIWVVVEVFPRGISSRTCEIEGERNYERESRANHVVEKTIIGSQRPLWEYPNDARNCYHEKVRKSYLRSGITWLSVTGSILLLECFVACITSKGRDDEQLRNENAPTEYLGCDAGRGSYKLTATFDIESAEPGPVVR
jgi:hypothetical protein